MTKLYDLPDDLDLPVRAAPDISDDPEVMEMMAAAGLIPTVGRRPTTIKYEILRTLEVEDIEKLATENLPVIPGVEVISKLREPHHVIARMIAAGKKDSIISAEIGYSRSRISILKDSPMFQELVAHYREKATQAFMSGQEKSAMIGIAAIQEVAERLEEAPEGFKNRELLELIEMAGDRTFAPSKAAKAATIPAVLPAININFVTPQHEATTGGGTIDLSATVVGEEHA